MSQGRRNRIAIVGVIGIALGVTFGLVYGYLINPVEWVDASIELARADIQEDYLRMAVDSYTINQDAALALQRWDALGAAGRETLDRIALDPGDQGLDAVIQFRDLVLPQDNIAQDKTCEVIGSTGGSLCQILWGSTLVLVGMLAVYFYQRTRPQTEPKALSTSISSSFLSWIKNIRLLPQWDKSRKKDLAPQLDPPPLANFMCTYIRGSDGLDETYSIDTHTGEFLGECGVELIRTGDFKAEEKASAFDIWLFDKNEINTNSVVLMCDRVYQDDVLRTQLSTKGHPKLAEIGVETVIETDHLVMRFRIVDMLCAQMDSGLCDYFTRLSIDINIWQVSP